MSAQSHDDAKALMASEKWNEALRILQHICKHEPPSYSVLWDTGWCLVKLGRASDALSYLENAVLQGPERPDGHWALGVARAADGRTAEAEEALRQSIALKDTYLARLALAGLYQEQKHFVEAEQVLREGMRLQPDHRERVEALADFLSDTGHSQEATKLYESALRLTPRNERKKSKQPDPGL